MARLLLLTLVLALWAPFAAAQIPPGMEGMPDWTALADRAEEIIDGGRASDTLLEELRADLVAARAAFRDAEGINAARVDAVRGQIAALGEPPAEGEPEEDAELAARRADLAAELDRLTAPARFAEAQGVQIEGLIGELDAVIDGRRRDALLMQETPPLNPATWLGATAALGAWGANVVAQATAPFLTETGRADLRENAVEVGLLLVVALVLVLRSRRWLAMAQRRLVPREAESPKVRLGLFAASVGQLVLPVLGLFALSRLLTLAGVGGAAVGPILDALPLIGFVTLLGRWLGAQAFPPWEVAFSVLPLPADRRRGGRWLAAVLGGAFGLRLVLEVAAETHLAVADAMAVPVTLLLVVAGLALARMGLLLLRDAGAVPPPDAEDAAPAEAPEAERRTLWTRLMRLLGRGAIGVGIGAPVLAAIGYVNAGEALFWPFVVTLALLAALGALQNVIFDLWAALVGRTDAARDALAPTLVAFALSLGALPLLALAWGVRPETLGDWWRAFLDGVSLGGTRISPAAFLTFAIVFVLGFVLTRAVQAGLRTSVLPKTNLDAGGTNAILSGTGYVGITLAALVAITSAGIDLSGLALVAGALSVGLGFGLQNIVQNFVSGIILLIERPIKIGDWVEVGQTQGFVRAISVRSTRIETFDRQDVIVPNADLIAQSVTNNTLGNNSGRVLIPVGVAYGNDTRRVQAVIEEVCAAHPMVVLNPPPTVTFEAFGASSLDFLARCVLRDVLWKPIVGSDIRHALAERFAAEGIEVPFPQQDVWLKNPEALRPQKDPE